MSTKAPGATYASPIETAMPWLDAHDYLKKKEGKEEQNFCGALEVRKVDHTMWGQLTCLSHPPGAALTHSANQNLPGPASTCAGSHWPPEAEVPTDRGCASDAATATSRVGIIDLKSRIARATAPSPPAHIHHDCPASRHDGPAPRYALPFGTDANSPQPRNKRQPTRARCSHANHPPASAVVGKSNTFFTANVAKFGLAQPLSTTQTRCVPCQPSNNQTAHAIRHDTVPTNPTTIHHRPPSLSTSTQKNIHTYIHTY